MTQINVPTFLTNFKNKDYFIEKWKAEDRDVLKKYKVGQFIKIIATLLDGTEIEVVIE